MAESYLTLAQWKARTVMGSAAVDRIEVREPGKILSFLVRCSQNPINARLRKRYAAPFKDPVPEAVLGWLTDLVTLLAFMLEGFNPDSAQDQLIVDAAKKADAEILEAADAEKGLFDLPLREDTTSSGIVNGAPLGSSDESPWAWLDRQREAVRNG